MAVLVDTNVSFVRDHDSISGDAMVSRMRTTVTLDPDVAAKVKAIARARGISFKQALNDAVRAGLRGERRTARAFKPYAQPMGLRPGFDLDKALRIARALEDHGIVRRLERRE